MGRYRPPRPYSSPYITLAGKVMLEDELRFLGYTKRPEVTKALAAAAAEGDRSENAEYIYRKKQLREIDSRLQYLVKRLEKLTCVDQKPDDESKVFFAAWVILEDEDGAELTYRLVGPDETDAKKGWISIDSPVAKALLKKQVGDEVAVKTPSSDVYYEIMAIHYDEP
ncbi:transcription elongation factor GreB [Gammaproteobacteria bacterium 45_16_T64]|nr:transcription elongation factor GreB [Gammaproteobacteria bacterium 45_16_T64]